LQLPLLRPVVNRKEDKRERGREVEEGSQGRKEGEEEEKRRVFLIKRIA